MKPAFDPSGDDLARVVAAALQPTPEWSAALAPPRASVALRFDELCIGATHVRLACAERELARLHRAELARLLRAAAHCARAPDESAALELLRAALREELACAAADGARATQRLHALLAGCLSAEPATWSASALALASLALHDVAAGRLELGRALLSEGRAAEAAWVFADALARRPTERTAAALAEGLGAAHTIHAERERARGAAAGV